MNTTVEHWMETILNMDIRHGVFRVKLFKSDHSTDWYASAELRGVGITIETHDEAALVALKNLYDLLLVAYGKCPKCGQYRGEH